MAILPIFIPHAGCPHQCVFCNQKTISGQKTAAESGAREQIARWLQWLRPSLSNEAAFYGGSFTALDSGLQERLLLLTDELRERGLIGSVRISTRPDYIDGEKLQLLRRHGVRVVELGVQSLDDKVLQAAGRGHTAADVVKAVELLRDYDFQIGLQLMVGMPLQSFDSLRQSIMQAVRLQPDLARIYPLLVIKDTPLAESWLKGDFQPLSLAEAIRQSAWAYDELTRNGIKVIRVGLQPDDELRAPGNILAGPFHPAMGELVQSFLLRERLTTQLLAVKGAGQIIIRCPYRQESKLRGSRNSNIEYWRQLLAPSQIIIEKADADEITVSAAAVNEKGRRR